MKDLIEKGGRKNNSLAKNKTSRHWGALSFATGSIYQEAMYDDVKVRKDKRAANKAITIFKHLGFKINIDDDNKTVSIMQKITETSPKKALLMPVQLALF